MDMTREEAMEIIDRWMGGSPFASGDVGEYMRETAERVSILLGVDVSPDDPVEFVNRVRECKIDVVFEAGYEKDE